MTILLELLQGKSNSDRDYDIKGSEVSMVFNAFGSISTIIVANTAGLLLEIQVIDL